MEVRAAVLACVVVLLGTLGRIANYPLPHLVALPVSTKCVCVHVCLHVHLVCDSKCVPFTHCMLMHTCMGHVRWLVAVHMEEWVCMSVCVSIHRVCACANGKVGRMCCCVCVCVCVHTLHASCAVFGV